MIRCPDALRNLAAPAPGVALSPYELLAYSLAARRGAPNT